MYENHFSIKLISIENLYIMTTMSHILIEKVKYDGIWYIKESDFLEQHTKWEKANDSLVKEIYAWKLAYSNQEKIIEQADLEITKWNDLTEFYDDKVTKLKSIIADYENKITKYLEKIDIQQASILSMKSEPVIECELEEPVIECETKICKGLKCKGKSQPLELFIKNGKTLKNCKICRDYKCSLCKKSRNKSKNIDLNELD